MPNSAGRFLWDAAVFVVLLTEGLLNKLNHVSSNLSCMPFQVRAGSEADHFLINPFGMLYSEITASSLVKVDTLGTIIDEGSTTMGINKAGYVLLSFV